MPIVNGPNSSGSSVTIEIDGGEDLTVRPPGERHRRRLLADAIGDLTRMAGHFRYLAEGLRAEIDPRTSVSAWKNEFRDVEWECRYLFPKSLLTTNGANGTSICLQAIEDAERSVHAVHARLADLELTPKSESAAVLADIADEAIRIADTLASAADTLSESLQHQSA